MDSEDRDNVYDFDGQRRSRSSRSDSTEPQFNLTQEADRSLNRIQKIYEYDILMIAETLRKQERIESINSTHIDLAARMMGRRQQELEQEKVQSIKKSKHKQALQVVFSLILGISIPLLLESRDISAENILILASLVVAILLGWSLPIRK